MENRGFRVASTGFGSPFPFRILFLSSIVSHALARDARCEGVVSLLSMSAISKRCIWQH